MILDKIIKINVYLFTFFKKRSVFYCMNYTLILIMFTSKVFSFYFRTVARDTIHSCLQWPRLYAVFSSFFIKSSPLRSSLFSSHVLSFYFVAIHLSERAPAMWDYTRYSFIPPHKRAFVGRDERRAPLKTPVWEATIGINTAKIFFLFSSAST